MPHLTSGSHHVSHAECREVVQTAAKVCQAVSWWTTALLAVVFFAMGRGRGRWKARVRSAVLGLVVLLLFALFSVWELVCTPEYLALESSITANDLLMKIGAVCWAFSLLEKERRKRRIIRHLRAVAANFAASLAAEQRAPPAPAAEESVGQETGTMRRRRRGWWRRQQRAREPSPGQLEAQIELE